jgi:putative chitinase
MNKQEFFNQARNGPTGGGKGILGPTLDDGEVQGCETILDAMAGIPLAWCAYALATAYHETAHTMQPIAERGGPKYFTRMYDVTGARPKLARSMGNTAPGDGPRYCGRGFVQLTWKTNYERASKETGVDLVAHPEKAMQLALAAQIMRGGMREGWFTGKSFQSYLPDRKAALAQFTAARRIINGTDKAGLIAGYAMRFQDALERAGWA